MEIRTKYKMFWIYRKGLADGQVSEYSDLATKITREIQRHAPFFIHGSTTLDSCRCAKLTTAMTRMAAGRSYCIWLVESSTVQTGICNGTLGNALILKLVPEWIGVA